MMSQAADLARQELANRGKSSEAKVKAVLEAISQSDAGFDYERKYDARAARGRFPSQAGDYGFYGRELGPPAVIWPTVVRHGLIEVKEVAHDFRIAKKNWGNLGPTGVPMKFGVLKKRQLAGGQIIIAVYHSTTKLWRTPDFQYFLDRASQPSWDLSEFPTYPTVAEALAANGLTVRQR